MANFKQTVNKLEEAYAIIDTWFKCMDKKQREEWWDDDEEHPVDKLATLCQELMPGYECTAFVNYAEEDDNTEDIISTIAGMVNKKTVEDFQYCDFYFDECHNRWTNHYDNIIIVAIKTRTVEKKVFTNDKNSI